MKRSCIVLVLFASLLAASAHAADPVLAGSWIGAIDTSKGQMDIGLNLTVQDGKLTGVLKTAHGDWEVTGVTEKDGVWTVTFKSDGGSGTLTGRIKEPKFAGDWKSPMATGTFELARRKDR
jgi:hypothetical protein